MPGPRFHFDACGTHDLERALAIAEDAMRVHVERAWGAWEAGVQRERFAASFEASLHRFVVVDGEAVGLVAFDDHDDHRFLGKLYLRSPFRGCGLGGAVLAHLSEQAFLRGVPIRLRVLKVNVAAKRFYQRHGFAVVGDQPDHVLMQADPTA